MPRLDLGPSLAGAKAAAVADIDRLAEEARLRFVTPGSGQALEYQATEGEARAFAAAGFEGYSAAAFPWLEAERQAVLQASGGAVDPPPRAVAEEVLRQAEQWKQVGSVIKEVRRGAKLMVDGAASHADVRAVLAATAAGYARVVAMAAAAAGQAAPPADAPPDGAAP